MNLLMTIPEAMFDVSYLPGNLIEISYLDNQLECNHLMCWLYGGNGVWLDVLDPGLITCTGPDGLAGRTWSSLINVTPCKGV